MPAFEETIYRLETEQMPTPGTLAHLEYLSGLVVEDDSELSDARSFLEKTMAATSLARIIRRHRSYWPMRNIHTADLDTRIMVPGRPQSDFFRGSIGISRILPNHNNLIIHRDSTSPDMTYSYDVTVPVDLAHIYDPSRAIQASYLIKSKEGEKEIHTRWVYNEAASEEYEDEHDPQVLICAVQEAAVNLMQALGHTPGERKDQYELRPSDPWQVHWHPDYHSDDPNEFVPRITIMKKAIEQIRRIPAPWRPAYLRDSPDEFIEKAA